MIWNYFKTNWFYFTLGALLMVAAARKFPGLNPFNSSYKKAKTEKFTAAKPKSLGGESLLGLMTETPTEPNSSTSEIAAPKAEAFLKRFAHVAVSERKKFGIPASVILAAAYANSQAGSAEIVAAANNFFALPCADAWEGESAQVGGQCVRKYETAWASFRDFSIHLTSQEWFGSLKKSAGKDGLKWVDKLGAEHVANAKEMREVIVAFRLHELDAQKAAQK